MHAPARQGHTNTAWTCSPDPARPAVGGSDAVIQQVRFRVVGTLLPDRTAATFIDRQAVPGISARLSRSCNRVEAPDFFTGLDVDGGYTQYMVIPEDFAYLIPNGFSEQEAAPLLCAGIIGYRALRLSEVKPGQRLGLYGFGASAHVSIQVAIHWGCTVYVFTRGKKHQELARKLGATWVGHAKDDPPERLHSSIIFAPAGELVLDALRVLQKGGTLALAGIYMTPIPQMDYGKYLYHERTIRSVANSTRRDGEELLKIAAEIPIHTKTHLFPLEDANLALQALKHDGINGAGVLEIT